MIRHRELSRILPELSQQNIFTMVVTSGIIPIPMEWMGLRRNRVAVSIDGLPEHHDPRRKPATYERILENIREPRSEHSLDHHRADDEAPGISGRISRVLAGAAGSEADLGEHLQPAARRTHSGNADHGRAATGGAGIARPAGGLSETADESRASRKRLLEPPKNPQECLFSKMSTNFSADLTTRVEPCIFGGTPDCSQCGCVVSSGLHHVQQRKLVGPLRIGHLVRGSTAIGSLMNRLRSGSVMPARWQTLASRQPDAADLVQIGSSPVRVTRLSRRLVRPVERSSILQL